VWPLYGGQERRIVRLFRPANALYMLKLFCRSLLTYCGVLCTSVLLGDCDGRLDAMIRILRQDRCDLVRL
jgi:hypothetical protein